MCVKIEQIDACAVKATYNCPGDASTWATYIQGELLKSAPFDTAKIAP